MVLSVFQRGPSQLAAEDRGPATPVVSRGGDTSHTATMSTIAYEQIDDEEELHKMVRIRQTRFEQHFTCSSRALKARGYRLG